MDDGPRINAIAAPAPSGVPASVPYIGILVLETRFPRPAGDIGNPASFPVPARALTVRGALPAMAVRPAGSFEPQALLEPFLAGLRRLEEDGAAAVTTSCGFLVLLQDDLQRGARVPVVTSSLTLLPRLLARHPRVGVLTIDAASLGPAHFLAAGVPRSRLADVVVEGVDPSGAFARGILGDDPAMDPAAAARDVVDAATRLKARAPHLTDLVLECTNMPPAAPAVEAATGMRTWSLLQSARLLAPFGAAAAYATL